MITTTLANALTGLETHIGMADSSLATADPRLRQAFCTEFRALIEPDLEPVPSLPVEPA